jgi:hypothetical protein
MTSQEFKYLKLHCISRFGLVRKHIWIGPFLRTRRGGGGGGGGWRLFTKRDHTILSVGRWQMHGDNKLGVVLYVIVEGSRSVLPQKMVVYFHPQECISCVFRNRLLDIIFSYVLAWYVYVNTTTRSLTCL